MTAIRICEALHFANIFLVCYICHFYCLYLLVLLLLRFNSPESEKHDDFLNPIDSSNDAGGFLEIEPLSQLFEKSFEASSTNNSSEASNALREGVDRRIQRQLELKWGKDSRHEPKKVSSLSRLINL